MSEFLAERGRAGELDLQLERTRDPKHGDFTSNIALRLSKELGHPPRELAETLSARLEARTQRGARSR